MQFSYIIPAEPVLWKSIPYKRAVYMEVSPGIEAAFCSLDDLIDMKTKAGRPLDIEDIAQLRKLSGNKP